MSSGEEELLVSLLVTIECTRFLEFGDRGLGILSTLSLLLPLCWTGAVPFWPSLTDKTSRSQADMALLSSEEGRLSRSAAHRAERSTAGPAR